MSEPYQIILADPPWSYQNDGASGLNGLATSHYRTMQDEDIYNYLGMLEENGLRIAQNSALFLWCTNPLIAKGLETVRRWGYVYKTNIVWVKSLGRGGGGAGIGYYVRGNHELLSLGIRGSYGPSPNLSPPPSSVISSPRTQHSRKPLLAYELIERMYPDARRLELFAREIRPGWEQNGDQLGQQQIDLRRKGNDPQP